MLLGNLESCFPARPSILIPFLGEEAPPPLYLREQPQRKMPLLLSASHPPSSWSPGPPSTRELAPAPGVWFLSPLPCFPHLSLVAFDS